MYTYGGQPRRRPARQGTRPGSVSRATGLAPAWVLLEPTDAHRDEAHMPSFPKSGRLPCLPPRAIGCSSWPSDSPGSQGAHSDVPGPQCASRGARCRDALDGGAAAGPVQGGAMSAIAKISAAASSLYFPETNPLVWLPAPLSANMTQLRVSYAVGRSAWDNSLDTALGALGVQSVTLHPGPGS